MLDAVSEEAIYVQSLHVAKSSEVGLNLLASNDTNLGKFIHFCMYLHHNIYIERKEVKVRITMMVVVDYLWDWWLGLCRHCHHHHC